MVNSIGSVKMAVMARFLSAGSLSQNIIEEAGQQKLVSQYIHKQLCDADEANLLDEKDMHVFGLQPMTDPLYLVSCNACKKPVKASQYAAHAELCRSFMSSEELLSECNNDARPKRPPKMSRKRSKAAGNQVSPIVVQGCYETMNEVNPSAAASRSHPMRQEGPRSSIIVEPEDFQRRASLSSAHGNCLTSPNAKAATAAMMPLSKRPKLYVPFSPELAADMVQSSDGILAGRVVRNVSSSKNSLPYVPAPLATKMYNLQSNNRLRAALSYMYHEGAMRHCSDEACPKVLEGNFTTWEATSPRLISDSEGHLVKQAREKSSMPTLPPLQIPNQTIGDHSGLFVGQTGGYEPMNCLPNQSIANDALTAQKSLLEMQTRIYSLKPCPRTGNSGAPLATIEQPDGVVPVV